MQIIALFYIIHRITLALTLTGVAMVLCSCQTSQRKTFDRIQVGMDKSTVVEALGSPTATRRQKGKDRWIYEFRDGPQEPATRADAVVMGCAAATGMPTDPSRHLQN